MAITGAAGFIGAHLVRRLLSLGYEVVAIDSLHRGLKTRLPLGNPRLTFAVGDACDQEFLEVALRGCAIVFHLAAVNGTKNFYDHPDLVLRVGVRSCVSVVEACITNAVSHLIVASSAEVYHQPVTLPTPESERLIVPDPLNPRFSYGGSKIATELYALHVGGASIPTVSVFRPHNIYGPDMGYKHVIPQFITQGLELKTNPKTGSSIRKFVARGNLSTTRSFCYIDDLLDGLEILMATDEPSGVFHIGNSEEVCIRDVLGMVLSELDLKIEVNAMDSFVGETSRRCPDITKIARLGYSPKIGLQEGIKRTITWYIHNYERDHDAGNNLI